MAPGQVGVRLWRRYIRVCSAGWARSGRRGRLVHVVEVEGCSVRRRGSGRHSLRRFVLARPIYNNKPSGAKSRALRPTQPGHSCRRRRHRHRTYSSWTWRLPTCPARALRRRKVCCRQPLRATWQSTRHCEHAGSSASGRLRRPRSRQVALHAVPSGRGPKLARRGNQGQKGGHVLQRQQGNMEPRRCNPVPRPIASAHLSDACKACKSKTREGEGEERSVPSCVAG